MPIVSNSEQATLTPVLDPSFLPLCNEALDLVGVDSLASLQADNPTATLVNRFAQASLERLLRLYPWNCAQAWAQLQPAARESYAQNALPSKIAGSNGAASLFVLPSDCTRILSVDLPYWQRAVLQVDQRWQSVLITCAAQCCKLHYVRKLSQADQLDPLLAEAFTYQLAARLSAKFIESNSRMQGFLERADFALNQAKHADGAEQSHQLQAQSWLISRAG